MAAGPKSNAPSANGSGGSSRSATTTTPIGCRSAVAFATFGGHPSVATIVGGKCWAPTPATTSPPPVWMSRAAAAAASFAPKSRWYSHDGRCSVARPSNQEKSHPSTDTVSASSTSWSKDVSTEPSDHVFGPAANRVSSPSSPGGVPGRQLAVKGESTAGAPAITWPSGGGRQRKFGENARVLEHDVAAHEAVPNRQDLHRVESVGPAGQLVHRTHRRHSGRRIGTSGLIGERGASYEPCRWRIQCRAVVRLSVLAFHRPGACPPMSSSLGGWPECLLKITVRITVRIAGRRTSGPTGSWPMRSRGTRRRRGFRWCRWGCRSAVRARFR